MAIRGGTGWMVVLSAALLLGCGDEAATMSAPARGQERAAGGTPVADGTTCWTDQQRADEKSGGNEMPTKQYDAPPAMAIDPAKRYAVTMETNKGTIEAELYPAEAPKTVNNFVCLARDGYFDGTPFHRIVKGFVVQGGDPTGTGTGGPGYKFEDEPVSREYERGILAMANSGPNTNGSQFFIILDDLRNSLPKNYTIFGKVTGGDEAVDAMAAVPTKRGPSGEQSQPTEPVTLERVTVAEQ